MHALTREAFLDILGLSSGAFDQLQYEECVALAFGVPVPGTPGRYLDLDLVAMAINLALTPTFGRERSTAIVGGYFNAWASAVGAAEADPGTNYFMAVGGVEWNAKKRRPELLLVTAGTLEEIAADFRQAKNFVGSANVNVTDIIARLRRRAAEFKITLDRPMFFAPHDPRFSEIVDQVVAERDARMARFRKDKKKLSAARQRTRRSNITAMPRVRDMRYPIEMTA